MTVSAASAAMYLKLDYANMTNDEKAELDELLASAKAAVAEHCGLTAAEVNASVSLDSAIKLIVQDLYDTRTMHPENNNINPHVGWVLGLNDNNLL